MPDLYEKLGDLLNDVLESGKIPEEEIISEAQKVDRKTENQSKIDSTGPFSFNQTENQKSQTQNQFETQQKNQTSTQQTNQNETHQQTNQQRYRIFGNKPKPKDTIIRNYNYEQQIVYPPEIINAVGLLKLNFPFTKEELRIQYHNLLKQNHPDKENGSNQNLSVQQITAAYDQLKNYFYPDK